MIANCVGISNAPLEPWRAIQLRAWQFEWDGRLKFDIFFPNIFGKLSLGKHQTQKDLITLPSVLNLMETGLLAKSMLSQSPVGFHNACVCIWSHNYHVQVLQLCLFFFHPAVIPYLLNSHLMLLRQLATWCLIPYCLDWIPLCRLPPVQDGQVETYHPSVVFSALNLFWRQKETISYGESLPWKYRKKNVFLLRFWCVLFFNPSPQSR